MIQRMQTLLLFLAAGALGSLYVFPFLRTDETAVESDFMADGAYSVLDHPANMALFGLSALLALIAIFLFRNRKVQMQLTKILLLITGAAAVVAGVLYVQDTGDTTIDFQLGVGAVLPVVAIILMAISHRLIRRDEKLVRSMDRLR